MSGLKPLKTTHLATNKPICCPCCKKPMDMATGEGMPSEGAISICLYCQCINKYVGKGMDIHLVKLSEEELLDIKTNSPGLLE